MTSSSGNTFDSTFVIVDNVECVDICLCVDRSGSMMNMFNKTIEGIRKFIKEQKETAKESGIETFLTIKSFNDNSVTIPGFNKENILNVDDIDVTYFCPRGGTKLIDTTVESLLEQNRRYENWKSKKTNSKMQRIFALLTDGKDTCSKLYDEYSMNKCITKMREEGTICIFLGANQDAIKEGHQYGFSRGHSMTYSQTNKCAEETFRSLSECVSSICKGETITEFTEIQRSASCNTRKLNIINNDLCELRRC